MKTDWFVLDDCIGRLGEGCEIGASVLAPGGQLWHHRGDRQHPAASTAKIPIMIEIHRLLDRECLRLDDQHWLSDAEKSPGSGVLRHMHTGLRLSIADLLYLMMSISDNTATNILLDRAGMANVNATMADLGMTDSILGRPMRGRLAVEGEQENLATANDYTRVMHAIATGKAASAASCEAMLSLLARQQNARRIGRHVPNADGVRWGSKTGTNDGVVNDVGFVDSPAGTLLLALYWRGSADEVVGEAVLAEVTRCAMFATGLLRD